MSSSDASLALWCLLGNATAKRTLNRQEHQERKGFAKFFGILRNLMTLDLLGVLCGFAVKSILSCEKTLGQIKELEQRSLLVDLDGTGVVDADRCKTVLRRPKIALSGDDSHHCLL